MKKLFTLLLVLMLVLTGCGTGAVDAVSQEEESSVVSVEERQPAEAAPESEDTGPDEAPELPDVRAEPYRTSTTGLDERDGLYLIQSLDDLVYLRNLVAEEAELAPGLRAQKASYLLTEDLDLSEACREERGWTPIGAYTWGGVSNAEQAVAFCGVFDGGGHAITGLTIRPADEVMFYGLFGAAVDAEIKNLRIQDCKVRGGGSTGAVAGGLFNLWSGEVDTLTIRNCHVTGTVSGEGGVGGVVGVCANVIDCSFSGVVQSSEQGTGGVAGRAAWMEGCHAKANVTGIDNVGGVVGYNYRMRNCYFLGGVTGYREVGGVAGSTSVITGCYNAGEVNGYEAVGGLVGRISTTINVEPTPIQGRMANVLSAAQRIVRVEEDEEQYSFDWYIGSLTGFLGGDVEVKSAYVYSGMEGYQYYLPYGYNGEDISHGELMLADTWRVLLLGEGDTWESNWRPQRDGYYPQLAWEMSPPVKIDLQP